MSLLRFCVLIVVISLLSTEGQRALRFHQKYLNLCYKDELRSYGFGRTWGHDKMNDIIFIFGWTISWYIGWPLIFKSKRKLKQPSYFLYNGSTWLCVPGSVWSRSWRSCGRWWTGFGRTRRSACPAGSVWRTSTLTSSSSNAGGSPRR